MKLEVPTTQKVPRYQAPALLKMKTAEARAERGEGTPIGLAQKAEARDMPSVTRLLVCRRVRGDPG